GNSRLLGEGAGAGWSGGADLMVDVVIREQRRESLHVARAQGGGEAFWNVGGVLRVRLTGREGCASEETRDQEASAVHGIHNRLWQRRSSPRRAAMPSLVALMAFCKARSLELQGNRANRVRDKAVRS